MTAADPLLTPFILKSLTLRNRIVSTAHEPAYSEDGLPKDRYRAYHVAKARGGVGLTMIGGSALVSRESSPAWVNSSLNPVARSTSINNAGRCTRGSLAAAVAARASASAGSCSAGSGETISSPSSPSLASPSAPGSASTPSS